MKHLYIMIALFSLCTNTYAAEAQEAAATAGLENTTTKNYERFIGIKASLGLGFETSGVYYKESPYYSYDTIDLCAYSPL